jgi:hypothetical protein
MRAATITTFDSRAEFSAAVIQVLQASRHAITLVDRSFEGWPLESAAGQDALRGALRRGASMRLLVGSPDWIQRNGHRFMRTRRDFSERIACRELPPALRIDEGILIGDGQHKARRTHWDGFRGRLVLASPSEVEPLLGRYEQAWDESTPCLPATTLGL